MNTSEQTWGAPPAADAPQPAQWSTRKTLAAVGIAAVLAAGGAAVIYAADSGGAAGGPGAGGPGFGGGSNFGGGPGGPGGSSANLPTALHGRFVVSDGHGGFTTELTQTGTVTGVSDTAISARSDDGFTQTYVITTDTRMGHQPVQAGDTATIRAVDTNGTATAKAVSPQR
jgi:hypothetical protein